MKTRGVEKCICGNYNSALCKVSPPKVSVVVCTETMTWSSGGDEELEESDAVFELGVSFKTLIGNTGPLESQYVIATVTKTLR